LPQALIGLAHTTIAPSLPLALSSTTARKHQPVTACMGALPTPLVVDRENPCVFVK